MMKCIPELGIFGSAPGLEPVGAKPVDLFRRLVHCPLASRAPVPLRYFPHHPHILKNGLKRLDTRNADAL